MRDLPDQRTAVVATASGDASIVWMPALQPDDPDLLRARLQLGPARFLDGLRLVRRTGEDWRDEGPAPPLRDDAWHPDLPDDLGEEIALARRVIASIPYGAKILMMPKCVTSSSGFKIGSDAIFYEEDEKGFHSIVADHQLDRIPFVRTVERSAQYFADWLGATPHNDGSGIAGDLAIDVSAERLAITYNDENEGGLLSLSSEIVDGVWRHATTLRIPIYEDAMGVLRATADPLPFLTSFAEDSETWAAIVREDASVEAQVADRVMTLAARPGTLLRDRD